LLNILSRHGGVIDDDPSTLDESSEEELINLDDSMLLLTEHATPTPNSLVCDILFRPTELEDISMWDQFEQYEKVREKSVRKKTYQDDDMDTDDNIERETGVCKVIFSVFHLFI
jgi:hypothetical protein